MSAEEKHLEPSHAPPHLFPISIYIHQSSDIIPGRGPRFLVGVFEEKPDSYSG